jgi:hypothetical protein
MRARPFDAKELVFYQKCRIPDPAFDPNEILVGGDGTVDQHHRGRSAAVVVDEALPEMKQHDGEILVEDALGAHAVDQERAVLEPLHHLLGLTLALAGTMTIGTSPASPPLRCR